MLFCFNLFVSLGRWKINERLRENALVFLVLLESYLTDLDIDMMHTVVQYCRKISCLPSIFVLGHDFYFLLVSPLCFIFLFPMEVFLKFETGCNLLITIVSLCIVCATLISKWWFKISGLLNCSFFCNMQSDDEREMCARTIYCTNIDKKVYLLLEKLQNKYFW